MSAKTLLSDSNKLLNVNDAAIMLGVSDATVRNWIKTKVIESETNSPNLISKKTVSTFLSNLKHGNINRLQKRANKTTSGKTIIPSEYISEDSLNSISSIINICKRKALSLDESLLHLIIAYLIEHQEINLKHCDETQKTDMIFKRRNLEAIIHKWQIERSVQIDHDIITEMGAELQDCAQGVQDDLLGAFYQALSVVGKRSQNGTYYTPVAIVKEMIAANYKQGMQVLDPCCGTGQFLLACAKQKTCKHNELYGFDIDFYAVNIASINLLMAFPEHDFQPNIALVNTLSDLDFGSIFCKNDRYSNYFDFIATNPPWGAKLDDEQLPSLYPDITSGESYSYFIVKCYDFLKRDGVLSVVLPESILNIASHKDIRSFILQKFTLKSIVDLGRPFKGVYTKVYRMDMAKTVPSKNNSVSIKYLNDEYEQQQQCYKNNKNSVFSIHQKRDSSAIIKKVYSYDHITLKGNADWALGIVTGNNRKHLSDIPKAGYEPIFRGKDLMPMYLGNPNQYIQFTPEIFQQVAPEWKYRAKEKLVYKFISKKLVFSYDDSGSLTLNSANICIPKDIGLSMKALCALLNTKTYNYIYQSKFYTHKVLRSNLEELPIPLDFLDGTNEVAESITSFLHGQTSISEIDKALMRYFDFTKNEIESIHNSIK